MNTKSTYAWHQGKLLPFADATLHFLTSSLHYGTAVFEGIRAYQTENGTAIFRLREHIQRLFNSAHILGLKVDYSVDEIVDACHLLVRENKLGNCYIRPLFYVVDGGWNLSLTDAKVECSIAAWPWDAYLGENSKTTGVRVKVSSFSRHFINASMTKAKVAANYVNSVLAKSEVQDAGYDDAILLDHNGLVSECSGQNLFLVRAGKVFTPPSYSILEGITRDSVLRILEEEAIYFQESALSRDQLYIADELFMVGTANEVIPINCVDGRLINNGQIGLITKQVQSVYSDIVCGKNKAYADYLDYVSPVSVVA